MSASRLERLRTQVEEPLLVSDPANLFYLSGFESTNAALLVSTDGAPRLFTDFRYAATARSLDGFEVVETQRNLYADLAQLLDGRIGFEASSLTYDRWETLRDGGLELVPRRGVVERLRAVKDERELDLIRRAAAITTRAYERLAAEAFVGRTERELASTMELLLREEGAEGLAFDIGLGTGPGGGVPHAHPSDRRVESGHLVVVDAGAKVGGYCSDCTRTFAAGELDDESGRIYELCLDAQQAALAATRAGAHGRAVDAVARERIAAAGYGEQFGHGLGHGLGVMIHEAPVLRPESEDTLEPGNVVTVEPGIYLADRQGVRIEDLVVVTDGEPEVLTSFTKELVTVH
jgi:Xaa-Pro aminopeptidase